MKMKQSQLPELMLMKRSAGWVPKSSPAVAPATPSTSVDASGVDTALSQGETEVNVVDPPRTEAGVINLPRAGGIGSSVAQGGTGSERADATAKDAPAKAAAPNSEAEASAKDASVVQSTASASKSGMPSSTVSAPYPYLEIKDANGNVTKVLTAAEVLNGRKVALSNMAKKAATYFEKM
jgi:hypothetical protein